MLNFFNNWFLDMAAWGLATDITEEEDIIYIDLNENEVLESIDIIEDSIETNNISNG